MLRSKVYCEDWLPPFQDNISAELLNKRNHALLFNCLQLCSAIIGLLSYFLEKDVSYLFVNVVVFLIGLIGLYGALKVHQYLIGINGFVSAGCIGAFLVLQVLQMLFLIGYEDVSNSSFERIKLFFLNVPYMIDLASGIFSLKLLISVLESQEESKCGCLLKKLQYISVFHCHYSRNCVVCKTRKRDMLFTDCGHKCLCKECKDEYMRKYNICPVCKKNVRRCIQVNN
uniref:RING-type domain-containing protein n=1 Tax=Nyctotherus ovalis TaxID=70075 RepID=A6MI51_NYCOV|nr:hypothetical protein [Nyctotherus ovalis]